MADLIVCLDYENETGSSIFERQRAHRDMRRTLCDRGLPESLFSEKRLKDGAVPSIFAWNKDKNQYKKRRSVTEKLEAIRTEEDEATDTASERKGDPVTNSSEKNLGLASRKAQTFEDDM